MLRLTMTQKTLLGLTIILSIALAGIAVLPAWSDEVMLVTSPDRSTFFIPAGKPFNITCKGAGDDAEAFSSLQWLNQDGKVIPKGNPGTQETKEHSLILTFTDPKVEDSGVYKCMARYKNEHTLQKNVLITFHGDKPVFDSTYQTVTASEHSSVEIYCKAEGESPITYEWFDENENKISENHSSISVSQRAVGSALVISSVTLSDEGMYTCLASNRHGMSSKIFQLTVLSGDGNDTGDGTETTFRGALVDYVTTTSVKFTFILSGRVENIKVLYTESRNDTENYHTFNYGENYEIKDLTPAGLYTFKFKTYPTSNDEWSKPYSVVLLPDTPEVIFRTIDSGTVKLEWLFKFEDRMRKTIDRHEITYFTVRQEGVNSIWKPSDCAITIRIPECTSTSYTISGLNEKTYYEIQLRAHTSAGYSEPYKQKIYFS